MLASVRTVVAGADYHLDGAHYSKQGETCHVAAKKVDTIINLTGAGDSFNAGFMAAVSANRVLTEAVEYACVVAAAKISGLAIPRSVVEYAANI